MVAPILRHVSELTAFQLRDGATNKMVSLLPPGQDGAPTSINLEIFDVGGRQNPNSHPGSAEAFYFLSGSGLAHCDGDAVPVRAGDFLILPAGSLHFIENTGPVRLYALTTLLADDGSHDGSTRPQLPLDPEDVAVIDRAAGAADHAPKPYPRESAARSRLRAAGLELPPVTEPRSRYISLRRHRDLAFCAGVTSEGLTGVAGDGGPIERAREAARAAALRQLAYLEAELGSLDEVADVLRLTGYVACVPGFDRTPEVIDAASEVYLAAFGHRSGAHARSAVGVAGLPGGALVELDAVVSVRAAEHG